MVPTLWQEEAEWREVLQKHEAMVGQLSAVAAGAAAADAALAAAPAQQVRSPCRDSAPCACSTVDSLERCTRRLLNSKMLNSQALVPQMQDEAGHAEAPAAGALRPEASSSANVTVQTAAAAPAARPVAEAGAALALRHAQTDAHRTLAIQVRRHCLRNNPVGHTGPTRSPVM